MILLLVLIFRTAVVDAVALELLADADAEAEQAAIADASTDDEALAEVLPVHMSPVIVMAVPDCVVAWVVSLAMANCAVMTRAMTAIPAANFFMVVSRLAGAVCARHIRCSTPVANGNGKITRLQTP